MGYASARDYEGLLNKAAPDDAEYMLDRASDLIKVATLNRGPDFSPGAAEALKRAACFQVEYWLEVGEAIDITAPQGHQQVQGISYAAPDRLAPRARLALSGEGLLYRGVSGA